MICCQRFVPALAPSVEANCKPISAVIFAVILAVAGVWSSRRRPWKDKTEKMAVAKAFMITSLPFILAETATGVISFATGQLPIPPPIGVGFAVDGAILLIGLAVAVARGSRMKDRQPKAEGQAKDESDKSSD